jgi:hypothetical protein
MVVEMLFSRNASCEDLSAGTSTVFAEAVVGAADAACQVTVIELSLSVNETDPLATLRAQPSGMETVNPPGDEWYGTNAVLSGMSPGGLLSGATGDCAGTAEVTGGGEGCWEPEEPVVGVLGGIVAPAPADC